MKPRSVDASPRAAVFSGLFGPVSWYRASVVPVTFGRSEGVKPAQDGCRDEVAPELSRAAPRSTEPGT
jgi:hypothetical protein